MPCLPVSLYLSSHSLPVLQLLFFMTHYLSTYIHLIPLFRMSCSLSQAELALSPDPLVRSALEFKIKLSSSYAKEKLICHSDKQTCFSYSWILLSLISFATIFLHKETNPIHSKWQFHFLLRRKKSVLFLSKALSWSFSILKTLILIGFLLFIPSLPRGVMSFVLHSFIDCLPSLAALKRMKKDLSVLTATTTRLYIIS